MATECRPVGAALPPRRDSLIQAAEPARSEAAGADWGASINVNLARDRMLEYFEREQLPGDVKATLAAALHGDLHYQSLLFTAMIDTWPRLQKAIEEIARLVTVAPWKVFPYAERGGKPEPAAEKMAREVEALVWQMRPKPERKEHGLEGTIKNLVRAYYYGHGVYEIRWKRGKSGEWQPRCTTLVPARFYGYPYDTDTGPDAEDRLMFDPEGGMGARRFEDWPDHRFLIAINTGHNGHPSLAAPLRALSGYWLAAVYGLKWFLNFTQLYGVPWRHAEVGNPGEENAVKTALASIGANGYIVTRPGTKINILAPGSTSAASLPQRELIELADQQCDKFILGQTLTSGTDQSGARALGEVHQDTLDSVVDGVADFVGGVLTQEDVSREEALQPGLPVETVAPVPGNLTGGTQASTKGMDPAIKAKLLAELRAAVRTTDPREAPRKAAAATRRTMLQRGLTDALNRGDQAKAGKYRKALADLPEDGVAVREEGEKIVLSPPVTPAPAKAGEDIGVKLIPKANLPATAKAAHQRAMDDAIDAVHGDGPLSDLVFRYQRGYGDTRAFYDPSASSHEIVLQKYDTPENSIVHEVGHWLDHIAFHHGSGSAAPYSGARLSRLFTTIEGEWGSYGDEFKGFMDAVKATKAYREIQIDPMLSDSSRKYLLSNHGLFARAYAQWISLESGDSVMMGHIEKEMERNRNQLAAMTQWEWQDFDLVRAEIRSIFANRKWLRK